MSLRTPLLCLALCAFASSATAQGAQLGFGNPDHDSSAPVEVTADQFDIQNAEGKGKFTGNVVVVQGAMRLLSDVIDVEYGPNLEGETEVKWMHAIGNVRLFNGSEAAEGNDAIYTVESGVVVMTGDVLVTQGDNTMAGEKLTVNLDTGVGLMEGRVRVLFNPEEETENPQ